MISDFYSNITNPHIGQSVTLTVIASDSDGDTLSYAYGFTSGSGSFTGSGATVMATPDTAGLNVVSVTVTDGRGGSATKTLDLTGVNQSPVISGFTSSEMNPYVGQTVTLTVTASDPDGDALSYAYAFTTGSGTITGSSSSVTAVVDNLGAHTITVTVTDGNGGTATQTLTLNGSNRSPVITDFTASETNPHPGANVTITTTASDPDGDALTYAYTFTAGSGTITGSGAIVTVTVDDDVVNTIQVTVTDGQGGSATRTLDLTGTNLAPSISSFTAAAGTLWNNGTDTKTCTVGASDSDGDTLTYSYSVISGSGSVAGTTSTGTFTTGTAGGMSTVRVTVSDPYGGQATSDVQIKVCGWKQLSSASGPGNLTEHVAVYDTSGGKMYIFGGKSLIYYNKTWSYTPSSDTWETLAPAAPLPDARGMCSVIYKGGTGTMVVFGGYQGGSTTYKDVWEYSFGGNVWTQLASSPAYNPSNSYGPMEMTAIYDGTDMIVFGGLVFGSGGANNQVWKYTIASGGWSWVIPVTSAPSARRGHSALYVGGGTMIVFGGNSSGSPATYYNDVWSFNISGKSWTQLASSGGPSVRDGHSAVYDGTGKMIIFGGDGGAGGYQNDVWVYTIATQTWASLPSLNGPSVRSQHSAVYDGNGNMIIYGGGTASVYGDNWMFVLP